MQCDQVASVAIYNKKNLQNSEKSWPKKVQNFCLILNELKYTKNLHALKFCQSERFLPQLVTAAHGNDKPDWRKYFVQITNWILNTILKTNWKSKSIREIGSKIKSYNSSSTYVDVDKLQNLVMVHSL